MPEYRSRERSRSPERSRRDNYGERRRRPADSRRSHYRSRSRSRSPPPRRRSEQKSSRDDRRDRDAAPESSSKAVARDEHRGGADDSQGPSGSGSRDNSERDEGAHVDSGPNFGLSGKLAAETNTVKGVVLKYNEPPEARKPNKNWRLYVFKGKEQLDMFHINKQSCYLLGRDRLVADIPIEHPSTSKQHAVIQFRQVYERNEFGDQRTLTKPFLIDLESANGTQVNDEKVPESRYYELRSSDVIKFAFSTREYVILVES